jgi:hypothetical protein
MSRPQRSHAMPPNMRNTPYITREKPQEKRSSHNNGSSTRVVSPDDYSMDLPMFPSLQKSENIPIPITNCMHRTPSEIQLCEDAITADYRDYCMFARIVNGISSRQSADLDFDLVYENNACLANIRRTRCIPPEESQSLHVRHTSLLQRLVSPTHNAPQTVYPIIDPSDNHSMIFDEDEIFVIDL